MWMFWALFAAAFLILCAWRMQGETARTHGSAAWCSVWRLFKAGLFKPRGIIVGDWIAELPVHYEQTHAITFGATGAGKGVSAVLPNLLSFERIFLLDPGGENTAIACKRWRDAGYEFRCINFFGMHGEEPWELPAHGFNPLDLLDAQSPAFAADALVIAEMLTRRSAAEAEKASFFKNTARDHLRAFIIHAKTAEPAARQNLASVFEYMHCDADEWDRLIAAMKANAACGGIVRTSAIALERRQQQAPEEFSGVLSTMQEELGWLSDPQVREFIARSDVDFASLKDGSKGAVISVVLPLEYNKSHAAISRLALACAVLTMQRRPLSKGKVLFLIDEAADLGRIASLPDWLATLRKYKVVLWPIFQNVGQVAELYGRGWQTLIGNCGLLQILGVGNDLETAEHTERLLGKCTIKTVSVNAKGEHSASQAARSLITADELRRMKEDQQVAIIGNLPAIILRKTPYWERVGLAGRFHPNPYREGEESYAGGGSLFAALWARIYYLLVFIMAPHPIAACLIAAPFLGVAALFIAALLQGLARA